MVGISVVCELVTVGGTITYMNTILYEIELIDTNGNSHEIQLYEIDDICGKITSMSTASLTQFFPSITAEDIARPDGAVDILIGMEYAEMHPFQIEWSQGLVLYQSNFGTGRVVGGNKESNE